MADRLSELNAAIAKEAQRMRRKREKDKEKLRDDQIAHIRLLREQGVHPLGIADRLRIKPRQVRTALRGWEPTKKVTS